MIRFTICRRPLKAKILPNKKEGTDGEKPVAKRPNKTSWTDADLKKLESLLDAGASAARASAALKRSIHSVNTQANKLGKRFISVREARKKLNPVPIKPNTMRPY